MSATIKRDVGEHSKGARLQKLRAIEFLLDCAEYDEQALMFVAVELGADVSVAGPIRSKGYFEEDKNYDDNTAFTIAHEAVCNTLVMFADAWIESSMSRHVRFGFYTPNTFTKERTSDRVKRLKLTYPDEPILKILSTSTLTPESPALASIKVILLDEYSRQYGLPRASVASGTTAEYRGHAKLIATWSNKDWYDFLSRIKWQFNAPNHEDLEKRLQSRIQESRFWTPDLAGKEQFILGHLFNLLDKRQSRSDPLERCVASSEVTLAFYQARDPRTLPGQGWAPSADAEPDLCDQVYAALATADVPESIYKRHYLRTVTSVGDPALGSVADMYAMLRRLMSLRDAGVHKPLSHGALEFLIRLKSVERLAAIVDNILQEHNRGNSHVIASITERLEDEAKEKVLIVEVEHDLGEEICGFQTYLRTKSDQPVPGYVSVYQLVNSRDQLERELGVVFGKLKSDKRTRSFQIQFVVDAPLFDLPFHELKPSGSAAAIGEEHVVTVRHRERLWSDKAHIRDAWKDYAEVLRTCSPRLAQTIRIPPPPDVGVIDAKGILYAGFVLAERSRPGANSHEKDALLRVMRAGAPYICWLHGLPEGGAVDDVAGVCAACAQELKTLAPFPEKFARRRALRDRYASRATLLWDDPDFNPFRGYAV